MSEANMVVQGFRFAAVAAGLKKISAPDLALIYSETEALAAGVFTTNRVKAAPVLLDQERLHRGRARAIIANAGNANACTGGPGMAAAQRTAALAAQALGVDEQEVLVASTGVIGQLLPVERIEKALPDLVVALAEDGAAKAAAAIMTTDSFAKLSLFEGTAGGKPYRLLGLAKGAGMIMPDMATMLCFIVTDLGGIDAPGLRSALREAAQTTFNRITVDGDTSTNDTVLMLANGMAGNGPLSDVERDAFRAGLTRVMGELAEMIVRDGEGASKLVRIKIQGAPGRPEALVAARIVANSLLVKTAFYGQDPNWGRIMAALGRSGLPLKEDLVEIWVDQVQIVRGGLGLGVEAERQAAARMQNADFDLTVHLHLGEAEEQVTTCDLTHQYVSINADYRT